MKTYNITVNGQTYVVTVEEVAGGAAAAPAPVEAPAIEEAPAQSDDLELIAILAAAISAYTGEPTSKFRVVSFKHIK